MIHPIRSAWDNPRWVGAIMHFPNDVRLIRECMDERRLIIAKNNRRLDPLHRQGGKAAAHAMTAGDVLAVLYVMDAGRLTDEPSLEKAIEVVQAMHTVPADQLRAPDVWRRVPETDREIRKRIAKFRRVWHLWAAVRMLSDAHLQRGEPRPIAQHLPEHPSVARMVQEWALSFIAVRGRADKPLLYPDAYLVPQSIPPDTGWTFRREQQPAWMLDLVEYHGKLAQYRRDKGLH